MRPLATPALLATLAAAGLACSSPCQDLADRICDCSPDGPVRDNCKTSVKNQINDGVQQPTDADQTFCQSKLLTCPDPGGDINSQACHALQSQQGKVACGIAWPPSTATP
jgi:hypothetical protein